MNRINILIGIFLLCNSILQASPVDILELQKGQSIGKYLEITKSKDLLSIEQVILKNDFVKSDRDIPRFGYVYDDYWAKLKVKNSTSISQKVYFEIDGPLEYFEIFVIRDTHIYDQSLAGMYMEPAKEKFNSGNIYPVLLLDIPVGESTVYFHPKAVAPFFPIIAHSEKTFNNSAKLNQFYITLYIGIYLFLFTLLIVFFTAIKGRLLTLLILSFIGYIGMSGFVNGIFRFIYSNFAEKKMFLQTYLFIYQNWPVSLSLYIFSISLFAVVKHADRFKQQKWYLKSFTVLCLVGQFLLGPFSLFDKRLALNAFAGLMIFTICQAIVWTYKNIKQDKTLVSNYLEIVGWSVHISLSSMQFSYFLGLTNDNFFASWGANIGFFVLLALQAFALLVKLNHDLILARNNYKTSLGELKENFHEMKKRDEIIKVFVDPVINTELSLHRNPIEFKPRIVNYTVMFFDMRGFTTKMEKLQDEELIEFSIVLNSYVQAMIDIIVANGGLVQKIIGDAIMCNFSDPNKAMLACGAIRNKLSEMTKERVSKNLQPIRFGTGLSTGKVINTNLGSKNIKLDRTILGNVVNQAAKIESLTKSYAVDVLLDQSIYSLLSKKENLRWVGLEKVGGKKEYTNLYEYFGHHSEEVIRCKLNSAEALQEIYQRLNSGDYSPKNLEIIDNLIRNNPQHNYYEGKIMDISLMHIRENIELITNNERVA
ncbi:hypothetical protein MEO40_12365 [Dolichospermum sp. ST_sed1]|nr:hypothetical protein [Dolichospermum sp. ST_sed1]